MGIFESFRVALGMLMLHKLRAFLTMLGVIIGVMSVTLIVMIFTGFQNYMAGEFQKMGSNTIFIAYDGGWGESTERVANIEGLTIDDVDFIMDRTPSLAIASANLQAGSQKAVYKDKQYSQAMVNGVDDKVTQLNQVDMVSGRVIDSQDLALRNNVCMIGQEVAARLFGSEDPLGKFVTFNNITLEVIGVMETVEILGMSNKKEVWVPISTIRDKWIGGDTITMIMTKPKEGYTVNEAMDDVWQTLMLKSGNKRIYRVDSQESMLGIFSAFIGGAGFVLSGIAALSLLVGGIGIMNIMLVSVTERTKEIGLRKAVGARRGAVLTQFLVEAAVLSLVGGLIGMSTAFVLGKLVSFITAQANIMGENGLQMTFPLIAGLMAAAFSALIGVVFGLYPAVRASGLSPIEALRTE